jgi:glycosyltransferase involved in cell wall biosynthesis
MKRTTTPTQTLSILVLSAKGWGTGSALRAFYIAEALKQRGHHVQFIKPLPTLPGWIDMALSCPYYFWKTVFTRHQVVLAVKPYPTVIPAMFWQKILGAKTVIDVDDLDFAYSEGLFRTIHEWLQKPWPRRADWVTYHNPKLKESLLYFFKVDPRKTIQLPQGVNETIFNKKPLNPENLPAKAAALYKAKPRKPILVFTAHLNVACDLEPALYAFKEVLHHVPQAQLLIAGGGPDENHFKKITRELGIEPSVHFTGLITISQVAACLKISDLTLVYYSDTPVNHHRASMKLREALVCGRPVIATRVGESVHLNNSVVLSDANPAAFSKAIVKTLKSKRTVSPSTALLKKWDWKDCVKQLEKELLRK